MRGELDGMASGQVAPLKAKARRIFEGLWSSYDRVLEYGTLMQDRRWKDWALGNLSATGGSRVLDVGCGTCILEEMMPEGIEVVGVDLTYGMLRAGQGKRLPRVVSLLQSDGERLPFRDSSFDRVVSCYVVKYCSREVLVSEMARVLKPGGRLVLYDFARPRGLFWPFNALYVYGVLRVVGGLLEMAQRNTSTTFTELPGIIARSSWEEGFQGTLIRAGFTPKEERVLSGGVAVGFAAEK